MINLRYTYGFLTLTKAFVLLFLGLILILGFQTCIKPYVPNFKDSSTNKYVVQGMITSEEGWHQVNVSITSPVNYAAFQPLLGCNISIIDDLGNQIELFEISSGDYGNWISQDFLQVGRGYKLKVITPKGDVLESDYDILPSGPEIKTPRYTIESHPVQDIGDFVDGLQFYIDLEANETHSKYYRWQLIETWEYHSRYPVEFYYDGQVQQVSPPDSSEFYCWTTDQVDEVFTLNTTNLTSNTFQDFPLHFVANTSSRLGILYSLLINQISLSESAYIYWDQLRQNNTEQGGLYSTQPLAVKGNISNLSNPENEVLGFFQASYVSSIRIFVEPPEDLPLLFTDKCDPILLEFGFLEIKPRDYPAYLQSIDGNYSMILLNDECVLCTLRGGSNVKPDFWP